jgi:C-terminal processing protease CtpA/Prc
VHRQIAPGVWVVAAVGTYSDESKTLPIPDATPIAGPNRPRGWKPSGDDRATRLADIILAWGVLEHFYPYFDVVKADWDRALADGLTTAATDADGAAFQKTLSHLGSQLHDGHVWVGGKSLAAFALPISWTWVGDQLVITSSNAALSSGLTRGDVVESLNGETVAHSCDTVRPFISGATEQWIRHLVLEELLMRETNSPVPVSVRRITGEQLSVQLVPTARGNTDEGFSRAKDGSEVAPGVMYFDLCGKNAKALEDHLKDLVAAKTVIFDVRGLPGDAAFQLFPHLSEKPLKSATWRVPVYTLPDREGVTYIESAWDLQPAQPLIAGRKVFLTDGSAISYAESCMGIIEAYKLGDIVGSATAGTNGNVNTISLPGGYSISFTGMQVLKHDGSTHHGVGIKPTIEAVRTVKGISEGRDEVLERALAELK